MKNRPTGLLAVCVISILLGSLGCFSGVTGAISLAISEQINRMVTVSAPPEHRELQKKLHAVAKQWRPLTIPLIVIRAGLSVCLLVGGIMVLRWKASGVTLLKRTLWVAIVVELITLIPAIAPMRQNAAIMQEYTQNLANAQPAHPGGSFPMQVMSSALMAIALVFGLGWFLAKLVFYVTSIRYLQRPAVRAMFEADSSTPA